MMHRSLCLAFPAVAAAFILLLPAGTVHADGTETLGPPGIQIQGGTGIVSGGTGLVNPAETGTVSLGIPEGVTVTQVLVYWNGFDLALEDGGDDTALVNGVEVQGELIGGPTDLQFFRGDSFARTYRADITNVGGLQVVPGATNDFTISGLDFTRVLNGASVFVIFDDGQSAPNAITFLDGQDWAYFRRDPPLDATVPQTFTVEASPVDRTAELTIVASSVQGPASGQDPMRPNVIRITTGEMTLDFVNELASVSGPEWDHITLEIDIPAGVTSVTVQILSASDGSDNLPASLTWLTGVLDVEPGLAEIGDFVWCDVNNDGVQDPDEPGIPGVELLLVCDGPSGMITQRQTTDADGRYLFTNLPPSRCTVRVIRATAPDDKRTGDFCPITVTESLEAGESFLDADFCFTPKEGEIGDTVWCDQDDDGVQDANEPGIPDVEVRLTCAGPDGALGTADDLLDRQLTDADGKYLFTGIPDGVCTVEVDEASPSVEDKEPCTPTEVFLILAPGESFLDADFCFKKRIGEIGDTVFCDQDDDGVQDANEPGIPGVLVQLTCGGPDGALGTADDFTDERITDANGKYLFTEVPEGLCSVEVDEASPSVEDKEPCTPTEIFLILGPGESFLDADFCFKKRVGQIGDTVFCDIDDDGVQDPNEEGIENVLVVLNCTTPDGTQFNDLQRTDADGKYLFTDIPQAVCTVDVFESASPLLDDKIQGNCPPLFDVDLGPGEVFLDADFCYKKPPRGSIGDTVWCDVNDDGIQQTGEPGIPGVRVVLVCASAIIAEQLTDQNGKYLFENLPPGLCTVGVDPAVPAADGKEPGNNCPRMFEIDLGPGEAFLDADFCFIPPPPNCDLEIVKTCLVPAPPSGDLECESKIRAMLLRYIGPSRSSVDVVLEGKDNASASYPNVDLVSGVTVLAGQNGFTIDGGSGEDLGSKASIFIDGQEEVIHTSCSTPFVAGRPAPLDDPKGDPSPNWFVEAFLDKEGTFVTVVEPEPSSDCDLVPRDPPGCDSDDKDPKPQNLTWKFTGGGCGASDNQQKDHKCSGSVNSNQSVTVEPDKGGSFVVPPGGEFTLTLEASKKIELENSGGRELNEIHTSCSQPIRAGDVYGSLTLVGIDGQTGTGNEVIYSYAIVNNGDSLADVFVIDNFLGVIAGPFDLASGESRLFEVSAEIFETTTNVVEVGGTLETGGRCEATDSATVTVVEPPPDSCDDGKPAELTFRYTGGNCGASANNQSDKFECSDQGSLPQGTVRIIASKKENSTKADEVYFNGLVDLDGDFDIKASALGKDKLESNTFFKILSVSGQTLQNLEIHTSCSAPLRVGDRFGGLDLVGFVAED